MDLVEAVIRFVRAAVLVYLWLLVVAFLLFCFGLALKQLLFG